MLAGSAAPQCAHVKGEKLAQWAYVGIELKQLLKAKTNTNENKNAMKLHNRSILPSLIPRPMIFSSAYLTFFSEAEFHFCLILCKFISQLNNHTCVSMPYIPSFDFCNEFSNAFNHSPLKRDNPLPISLHGNIQTCTTFHSCKERCVNTYQYVNANLSI